MARKRTQQMKGRKRRRGAPKNRSPRNRAAQPLGPTLQYVRNPFATLTAEEQAELRKHLREQAAQHHDEAVAEVRGVLSQYDWEALLCVLASYGLTVPVGNEGVTRPDHEAPLLQCHVELCQALALTIRPDELGAEPFHPEVVQTLWDSLTKLVEANQFRRLPVDGLADGADEAKAVAFLQERMKSHTLLVRNWGYYSQILQIATELVCPMDGQFEEERGYRFTDAIRVFEHLISVTERRSTKRLIALRDVRLASSREEMVRLYCRHIDQSEDGASRFIESEIFREMDADQLFMMLVSHNDIRMRDIYAIDVRGASLALKLEEDCIQRILAEFSLAPGSLTEQNLEHLFLGNPVWRKPVISHEDGSFVCVVPQLFFSFVIQAFESLLSKNSADDFSSHRAEYLERKIKEIVKGRLPEEGLVTNLRWSIDHQEFETDLIAVVDSHLVIVEAKSGRVTPPALRGAPERLRKHLEEILIAPNIQSKRLQDRLRHLSGNPEIEDDIRKALPCALEDIHSVVRVSVSLDDFGQIQTNIAALSETGWLPDDFTPCPTMNLADFETLFDLLDHPVHILHYLESRQELESKLGYIGDELDLMGLYLSTLFNIGDIEECPDVYIAGMSHDLDVYYNSRDAGIELPKPRPKISPLFEELLLALQERGRHRWSEFASLLQRISPDDQLKVMKKIRQLSARVRKHWRTRNHKNTLIFTPPRSTWCAVAFVLVVEQTLDRRSEFMENAAMLALSSKHVEKCLVVVRNIDRATEPYASIGVYQPP